MIESVTVLTSSGASLTLPLNDAEVGYLVQDLDGLDPVRAVMTSSSFAGMDGSQYQSARREERDITMKIGLEPDYSVNDTVRALRNRLYTYLTVKTEVLLSFNMDDDSTYTIRGRVETFEAPLFTKEPEIVVGLRCFDPDFLDPNPTIIPGLGTVSDSSEVLIEYEGTVETGIVLVLEVDRSLSEFTVYHRPPDGTVRTLDFAEDLVAGDILAISTVGGDKYITLNRGGTVSSLLNGMSPQSSWVELDNGDNHLRVYALGDSIPYSVTYTTRYGGL